jgi:hypothetical protein
MRLVHDCLDAQLIDRAGVRFGRVDRIVVVIDGDRPPSATVVEIGAVAIAARAHPRVGAWLARWFARRGSVLATPFTIPCPALRRDGNDFRVELDATTTPAWTGERWARDRIVARIPGSS